ncbi:replication initiation protein [Francisella sp. 19X1-34]|uniref:replication initiation protein n=1 Tax=Francisella sp. 19X1-34 TaxID=3087177 RepID=UPI002E320DF6|nr:replication initiation protein [Francisella sp. 19X1-34]MED7789665.1 replication initiation protein [Francisella sp. 19X1-34]
MYKEIIVTKKDTFVDAIYRLSLDEMRLFNYAIAKTNPFHSENRTVFISLNELTKFYGLEHRTAMYKEFNNALSSLFDRKVTYIKQDEEYGKIWVTCRLIVSKEDNRNGTIGFKFSDEINQLIKCDRDFLEYKLKQTVGITSPNSVRIYEMLLYVLKMAPNRSLKKEFSIEEIKNKLGLYDKYPRFSNFKKDVLEVAKTQINKHTDIKINYEVKKLGRTPVGVIFTAKYKPNAEHFTLEQEQEIIQPLKHNPAIKEQKQISISHLQQLKKSFKKF